MDDFFIGTDIVSVPRLAAILKRHPRRFRQHVFTAAECAYCDSRPRPEQHYAGRFAAKEALKKAVLATGMITDLPLSKIELTRRDDGAPAASIADRRAAGWQVRVSISHSAEFAIACGLIRIL